VAADESNARDRVHVFSCLSEKNHMTHSSFASLLGFTIVGFFAGASLGGCAVHEDVRDPHYVEHREDHPGDRPADRPADRPVEHPTDHPTDHPEQHPEDHPH